MKIDYNKFVTDYVHNRELNVDTLDGKEVDALYKDFILFIPEGITISKRMFIKQMRQVFENRLSIKPTHYKEGVRKYSTKIYFIKQDEVTLESLGYTRIEVSSGTRFHNDIYEISFFKENDSYHVVQQYEQSVLIPKELHDAITYELERRKHVSTK